MMDSFTQPVRPTVFGTPGMKMPLATKMRRQQTHAEEAVWFQVRAHRFLGLKFRRQQIVRGFICDFYCHALRLVVEVDGQVHESQAGYDHERDELLKSLGLTIVRFTNDEVTQNIQAVLNKLEVICRKLAENQI